MPTMTVSTETESKKATIAPPSMPMLQAKPEPTDIPDPTVPAAAIAQNTAQKVSSAHPEATQASGATPEPSQPAHVPTAPIEPQALGFLQWLQKELRTTFELETMYANVRRDEQFTVMKAWLEAQGSPAALAALDRQSLNGPPYQATVQATSPDGFAVSLTITKQDTSTLVEDLDRLLPWLKGQGYHA